MNPTLLLLIVVGAILYLRGQPTFRRSTISASTGPAGGTQISTPWGSITSGPGGWTVRLPSGGGTAPSSPTFPAPQPGAAGGFPAPEENPAGPSYAPPPDALPDTGQDFLLPPVYDPSTLEDPIVSPDWSSADPSVIDTVDPSLILGA